MLAVIVFLRIVPSSICLINRDIDYSIHGKSCSACYGAKYIVCLHRHPHVPIVECCQACPLETPGRQQRESVAQLFSSVKMKVSSHCYSRGNLPSCCLIGTNPALLQHLATLLLLYGRYVSHGIDSGTGAVLVDSEVKLRENQLLHDGR